MTSPLPASVESLLSQAKTTWAEAVLEPRAAEKYRSAHLAALRAAAAVLALRARPAAAGPPPADQRLGAARGGRARNCPNGPPTSPTAPARRAAIEAGVTSVVSERDADDLLRAAGEFIAIVERMVGGLVLGVAS